MQLKELDFVMEDIVQSINRVCVIGQRCPFSSSFSESTDRLIEPHHLETIHSQPRLSGSRRAREGTANSGIVIWSRQKNVSKALLGEVRLLVACPVTREP